MPAGTGWVSQRSTSSAPLPSTAKLLFSVGLNNVEPLGSATESTSWLPLAWKPVSVLDSFTA